MRYPKVGDVYQLPEIYRESPLFKIEKIDDNKMAFTGKYINGTRRYDLGMEDTWHIMFLEERCTYLPGYEALQQFDQELEELLK
jgi:hypothetical protein